MRNILFIPCIIFFAIGCSAQNDPSVLRINLRANADTFLIDLNDTNYTRIMDGVVLDNMDVIKTNEFEMAELAYISDSAEKQMLGISSDKPLMIIRSKNYKIEDDLDRFLQGDSTYNKNIVRFPTSIKFALSINGQIVMYREKPGLLSNLTLSQIKSISFLDAKSAQLKYGNTPFGVIEVRV